MKRVLTTLALVGLLGCDQEQVESAVQQVGEAVAEMTVEQLGSIASRILEDPSSADDVLAENGIDVAQLDSAMYEIATNPEERERYLAALAN